MEKIVNMIKDMITPLTAKWQSAGSEEAMRCMKEKLDEWKNTPLKVAVIGNSGVGKSSFINAIRSLMPDDEGAAEIGHEETTEKIQEYPDPHNPQLLFSDLPGVGTDRFPKETYLSDINFNTYDFFLLITAGRFTENDTWLAKEIDKQKKGFFFIRTQVDVDVSKEKKARGPKTHDKQRVVEGIHQSTKEHLKKIGFENVHIFLIDSYERQDYDFKKLEIQLINSFPDLKQSALILSLQASSEEIVKLKVEELRSRIWMNACVSAAVGAIPEPGMSFVFDLNLAVKQCEFYFEQLGLDMASLQRRANLASMDYKVLQSIVVRNLVCKYNDTGAIDYKSMVMTILQSAAIIVSTQALEEATKLIPVIGSIVGATVSYTGTHATLTIILNKMENTALEVVRFSAEQAAKR